jgi:REP element-mobilizing transposase RayT
VELDAFVIMPNHVHGIVVIVETLQCNVSTPMATATRAPNHPMAQISPTAGSLGAIIRSYKSAVSRWCAKNGPTEFAWQTRFYDHIIRSERDLQRIRRYITDNPAKWESDRNNPENLWM